MMIGAFLEHLETERGNSARTRNVRLGTIHSFFQYCALRHPEHAGMIARVLAIPAKRSERRTVTFLHPEETKALLDSPDRTTWAGRRDHALFRTAFGVCPLTAWLCGRCVHLPSNEFSVTQKRRTKITKEWRRGGGEGDGR